VALSSKEFSMVLLGRLERGALCDSGS